MRAIIGGIIVSVVIAVVVGLIWVQYRTPIYEAQASPSLRIGDPGYNLVGRDWSGLHRTSKQQSEERQPASIASGQS
jgi:hypothetical protein